MSKHAGPTDAVHSIKLTSVIARVSWLAEQSAAGESAPFEVWTQFVGDGAVVDVVVEDASGKKLGKAQGKITLSSWQGEFLLPDTATGQARLEARLTRHALKGLSSWMTILPRREIVEAKWDRAFAGRQETVELQATTRNVIDGTRARIEVFEADADGAHELLTELTATVERGQIRTKWECDYANPTRDIPSHDESERGYRPAEFFFRVHIGRMWKDSAPLAFKDWIEFHLRDAAGGEEYVLHLPDGSGKSGRLDENGKVRIERALPGRYWIELP